MKRRQVFRFVCGTLAAAALSVRAGSRTPLVVWVSHADEESMAEYLKAFRAGMRDIGYSEGRNISIEAYSGGFSRPRTEQLAAEIIGRRPAVVVAQGYAIGAMFKQTKTIPIVCGASGDLVESGLVASLARPGGNVTGIQFQALELVGKRVQLMKELVPQLTRVAVIADPQHSGERGERAATQAAADRLGLRLDYFAATNPAELDAALATARASGARAIVFFPDSVTYGRRERIAAFGIAHRLPTISGWDAFAEAGLLMAYGPNVKAAWARMAYFADGILKGRLPAQLPVEMPHVIQAVVNLRTAKAIGIAVPPSFLVRADRVIE